MHIVYRACAFAVTFGRNYRALFLEEERAMQYLVDSRGTEVKTLYERIEVEDGPTDSLPISDPASA